jgi:hypothetical protein
MSRTFTIPTFKLCDIYDEPALRDLVLLGRDRVFAAFDCATETYNGRTRGTNYYIGGAGSKQQELAEHVQSNRMKPFVSLKTIPELPPTLLGLNPRVYKDKLIHRIHQEALRIAVHTLVDERTVWFDGCVWNILPDTLETHRQNTRAVKKRVRKEVRAVANAQ